MIIKDFNPITGEKGKCLAVGRGATAIYLALKSFAKENEDRKVIVPANICYAAVLPVIYAGFVPVFCDVDKYSGNATSDTVTKVIEAEKSNGVTVAAAIIPHMYGNPVKDLPDIIRECNANEIKVIEDCASLMTAEGGEYIPGTLGDYVIYSTGYSKPVEIGYGGLLFSKSDSLEALEKLTDELPEYSEEFEREWGQFSKIYRILRNTGEDTDMAQGVYETLPKSFFRTMLISLSDFQASAVFDGIDAHLKGLNNEKLDAAELYRSLLADADIEVYKFEEGAVPWRFNFFVDPQKRSQFIAKCLENNVPISDWYPRVTPIFNDWGEYPGAKWHEEHILNLPLLLEEKEIERICNVIRSIL